MRLATEARAKLVKILQDAGLLTKVPENVSLETKIPFEDPEVRKAYLWVPETGPGEGRKKSRGVIFTLDGLLNAFVRKNLPKKIVRL